MMLREPWRTRLLFLSFAVNLITIPVAAGHFFYHRRFPPPLPGGPPRPAIMFQHISIPLAPSDKAKMLTAVEPHFEEIEVARIHMEAARAAMLRAIGSDPFDPDALQAAMHNWQSAWKVWSDDFGDAFLEAVKQVSADGRQKLATAGRRRQER